MLREQHLVYDDEAALIASSEQARRDLEQLFEADAPPDRKPERLRRALPLD
jgi:glutathione-regulated potassium-efflux system protein KefB